MGTASMLCSRGLIRSKSANPPERFLGWEVDQDFVSNGPSRLHSHQISLSCSLDVAAKFPSASDQNWSSCLRYLSNRAVSMV